MSGGEIEAEEARLELWQLLVPAAALLATCFYVVYMSVHLLALSFAWVVGFLEFLQPLCLCVL